MRAIGNDLHMDYSAIGQTDASGGSHGTAGDAGSDRSSRQRRSGWPKRWSRSSRWVQRQSRGSTSSSRGIRAAGARAPRRRVCRHLRPVNLRASWGDKREFEALLSGTRAGRCRPWPARGGHRGSPGWGRPGSSTSSSVPIGPRVGSCSKASAASYGKTTPYHPVRDLLKTYFQIEARDDDGTDSREARPASSWTLDAALETDAAGLARTLGGAGRRPRSGRLSIRPNAASGPWRR